MDEYIKREDAIKAITYVGTAEPTDIIPLTLLTAQKKIRKIPAADVVPKSEVVKEFTRRFEMYIGNCTFTLGQTNDIQYALKKAAEDMIGGK